MENLLYCVRAVLQTTPDRWNALVETIPAELLTRQPAVGEWSAVECLQHFIDTEKLVFPVRVKAFLAGLEAVPDFNPDAEGSQAGEITPAAMAAEFEVLRLQNLKLLESVTEADLTRQLRHSELGMVTLGEMLHEWAGHDLMHLVQAEQAMMQPFIAGCGAWQRYFVAHVAKGEPASA